MNSVLEEIIESGRVRTETGEGLPLEATIPVGEGLFLQKLIAEHKPTNSIEVGLAYGISTLFICDAINRNEKTRHVVIDPCQTADWRRIGLLNLDRAGFSDIIEFHEESSHVALPKLESSGYQFDFAFIDGMHTFDYALLDFFYIDRMLRVGGLVVFDDADYPGVNQVCKYVQENRGYKLHSSYPDMDGAAFFKIHVRRRIGNMIKAMRTIARKSTGGELRDVQSEMQFVPAPKCIAFVKMSDDLRLSASGLSANGSS